MTMSVTALRTVAQVCVIFFVTTAHAADKNRKQASARGASERQDCTHNGDVDGDGTSPFSTNHF